MGKRQIRRKLFTEKLFQQENIRQVARNFWAQLTMTELLDWWNLKLAPYLYTPRRAPPLSALPVVYVKWSCELELSQRESTFYVNRSHVTWRVLILMGRLRRQNWNKNISSISTYTSDLTHNMSSIVHPMVEIPIDGTNSLRCELRLIRGALTNDYIEKTVFSQLLHKDYK